MHGCNSSPNNKTARERGIAGASSEAGKRQPGEDEKEKGTGGASLWNNQGRDEPRVILNKGVEQGERGNQFDGAGVQHKTSNEHTGSRKNDGGIGLERKAPRCIRTDKQR